MKTVILEKRVCLEPMYLNANIKKHLYVKLNEEYLNKCTVENGFILKLYPALNLRNVSVSPATSDVVCRVSVKAEVLLPEVGDILEGKICMVMQQGILASVEEKMQILVPVSALENYKLSTSSRLKSPEWKKSSGSGPEIIKKDMTMSFEITAKRYKDGQYACIAKISS